jgi:hypothetical protein
VDRGSDLLAQHHVEVTEIAEPGLHHGYLVWGGEAPIRHKRSMSMWLTGLRLPRMTVRPRLYLAQWGAAPRVEPG